MKCIEMFSHVIIGFSQKPLINLQQLFSAFQTMVPRLSTSIVLAPRNSMVNIDEMIFIFHLKTELFSQPF